MKKIRAAIAAFHRSIYSNLRLLKEKLSPFSIVVKFHALLKLPAMTLREIDIYKKILLSRYVNEPLNIFEYGSGFSTIYFAKFLERKKIPFHIYSVDNNLEWHHKVMRLVKKDGLENEITLFIYEFRSFWEKEGWDWTVTPRCGRFAPKTDAEIAYINTPLTVGRKFDFISVDGRFRRRCLEIIPKSLKEKGVVFFHDAQKERYHEPLSLYRSSIFYDGGKYYPFDKQNWKIWIGSPGKHPPI